MRVISELFKRGDIVSADTLKPPSKHSAVTSYSLGSIRSSLSSYIWGTAKAKTISPDDPIVPVAALGTAAGRLSSLSGPMASADIHTVKSFAAAVTAGNIRDAEAVISHIVSKGHATALFTDATAENPDPVFGVKLGKSTVNPADKGVLRTKGALENMEQLADHLETSVASEKEAATIAAKAGNKSEALSRLRKKKVLEAKLVGARSAAVKLSDVLMAVDEAESNKEAVLALETGMASLKLATSGGVTAERVDTVAADFKEMMEGQTDVRMALEQLSHESAGEDAVLEQELEDLLSEDTAVTAVVSSMPVPAKTLADEAEEELAALLQSLPTPSEVPDFEKAKAQSNVGTGEADTSRPSGVNASLV